MIKISREFLIAGGFIFLCLLPQARASDVSHVFRRCKNSVVLIVAQDANQTPLAIGSGFFFRKNLIATNYHVVEGAASFKIKNIGTEYKINVAQVKSYSADLDLAILETVETGTPLPLYMGNNVEVGEKVVAIGNPRGLMGTVSEGIVSGIRDVDNIRIFQITAPVSPGSSGGPVLLESGEVLGIAAFSLVESQNLNFALPTSLLTQLETKKMKWEPAKNIKPLYKKDNAGIELVLFKKKGSEFQESFSLKNTTKNAINNLVLLIIYKTLRGDSFDFRVTKVSDTIPPGLSKMVTQESFDQNQRFSYRGEKNSMESYFDRFDIEIRVLSYDIIEQEQNIGDKLLKGNL